MSSQAELEAESRRMQRALDLLWHLTPSADNSRFDALELSEFLEADMAWGAAATPSLAWRFVSMDRGTFFLSFLPRFLCDHAILMHYYFLLVFEHTILN